jgi:hypothetical protein
MSGSTIEAENRLAQAQAGIRSPTRPTTGSHLINLANDKNVNYSFIKAINGCGVKETPSKRAVSPRREDCAPMKR